MEGKPPRACRWLIGAAGRIVPRADRPEWRRRWDRDVWNWWAFLSEHGAFDRYARTELIRHCWSAFPDALGTRVEMGPRLARATRSPLFCLALAALPLLLAAAFSHGFSGLRAITSPLPYKDAAHVVVLAYFEPFRLQDVAAERLAEWRKAVRFNGVAAYRLEPARLEGADVLEARTEPAFFDILGVRPALGRLWMPEDGSGEPAVILGYAAWQRLFHGDPAAGRTVMLNGRHVRVAGVLPREFWFFRREIAVWTLLRMPPPGSPAGETRYGAVARLRPFSSANAANRELSDISWAMHGRPDGWIQVLPLAERLASARGWCGGLSCLAFAVACALALLGYHNNPKSALFLVAKFTLILGGLALTAIELPAAVNGAGSAGHGLLVEPVFLIATCLALWWNWRDQRRRCRVCLQRLTLPVSFGNWGSPLLDRVGTELVCERGHGSLYVPGMHWSSSEKERWTNLDSSWTDLFSAK